MYFTLSSGGVNMANKGLPKKYAKHGFKRGWQLYKAAKRKRTGASRRTVAARRPAARKPAARRAAGKSSSGTKVIVLRGANSMQKKPTVRKKRLGRSMITVTDVRAIVDALIVAGGTISSLIAVNKLPWVKDRPSWVKALMQGGAGLASMRTLRRREAKKFAQGILVGGGVSATLPFVPEGLRVFGRRNLSPAEMQKLKTVGRPMAVPTGNNGTMGRPMSVPTNANTVPMMGRAGNRSSRYAG